MSVCNLEKVICITPYICPQCKVVLMREIVSAKKEIYKQTNEAEFEDVDEAEDGHLQLTLTCKTCNGLFKFL